MLLVTILVISLVAAPNRVLAQEENKKNVTSAETQTPPVNQDLDTTETKLTPAPQGEESQDLANLFSNVQPQIPNDGKDGSNNIPRPQNSENSPPPRPRPFQNNNQQLMSQHSSSPMRPTRFSQQNGNSNRPLQPQGTNDFAALAFQNQRPDPYQNQFMGSQNSFMSGAGGFLPPMMYTPLPGYMAPRQPMFMQTPQQPFMQRPPPYMNWNGNMPMSQGSPDMGLPYQSNRDLEDNGFAYQGRPERRPNSNNFGQSFTRPSPSQYNMNIMSRPGFDSPRPGYNNGGQMNSNPNERQFFSSYPNMNPFQGGNEYSPSGGEMYFNQNKGGEGQVMRPNGGHVMRPNGGQMMRPDGGQMMRPNGGQMMRPNGGQMTRPNGGQMMRPNGGQMMRPNGGQMSRPKISPTVTAITSSGSNATEATKTDDTTETSPTVTATKSSGSKATVATDADDDDSTSADDKTLSDSLSTAQEKNQTDLDVKSGSVGEVQSDA